MESTAARVITKSSDKIKEDKIKEILQKILNAMNDYIRNNSESVKSLTSARRLSIKKIATAIYDYYEQKSLINDFESNLGDLFKAIDEAARQKKVPELNVLKLLPELKDIYKGARLPQLLHAYHNIIVLIQNEFKSMGSWRNRSDLRDKLINAIAGNDAIAQEVGTNVYLAAYAGDLSTTEMARKPAEFANYLYEALTTSRLYQEGMMTATFNGSSKTYHVIFSANKQDAEATIKHDYPKAGCFGAQFSYVLRKTGEESQYIPSLLSIKTMDIWKLDKDTISSNQYAIECHGSKPEFVIAKNHPTTPVKKI